MYESVRSRDRSKDLFEGGALRTSVPDIDTRFFRLTHLRSIPSSPIKGDAKHRLSQTTSYYDTITMTPVVVPIIDPRYRSRDFSFRRSNASTRSAEPTGVMRGIDKHEMVNEIRRPHCKVSVFVVRSDLVLRKFRGRIVVRINFFSLGVSLSSVSLSHTRRSVVRTHEAVGARGEGKHGGQPCYERVLKTERKRRRRGGKEGGGEGRAGGQERLKRDQTAMTRKFSAPDSPRSFLACLLPAPDFDTTHPPPSTPSSFASSPFSPPCSPFSSRRVVLLSPSFSFFRSPSSLPPRSDWYPPFSPNLGQPRPS